MPILNVHLLVGQVNHGKGVALVADEGFDDLAHCSAEVVEVDEIAGRNGGENGLLVETRQNHGVFAKEPSDPLHGLR